MIERIWLRNFRRYVDEKIELRPGINFIDGHNNAGKTTILYAIEYALFGRVGQLKQLHTLMHPGAKEMGVELRFVGTDGGRYVLQRLHEKPPRSKSTVIGHFTLKAIAEQGERYLASSDFQDTEETLALKLQEILGLSRRLFEVAVHVKQGEIAAMLEGAPELDTVLGVTASVLAADELRAMALEYEKEASTLPLLQETLTRLRDEVRGGDEGQAKLSAELVGLSSQEATLTATLASSSSSSPAAAAVDVADDALSQFDDAHSVVLDLRRELARAEARVSDDVATLTARRTDVAAELAAAVAAKADADARRAGLERRLGDLSGRIERRRQIKADAATCETCGQPIDHAHAHTELQAWLDEQGGLEASLRDVSDALSASVAKTAQAQNALADVDDGLAAHAALDGHRQALVAPTATLSGARAALSVALAALSDGAGDEAEDDADDDAWRDAAEARIDARRQALMAERVRAETLLESVAQRRADAQAALEALVASAKDAARELARVESEVERLRERQSLAVRLRKLAAGFKALQVTLRDEAAQELSTELFAMHKTLSAPDEEYKSLSIDPARYVVNVTPHDIGIEVPAHLFQGGGHKVLLGLSFKLAVARRVGACPFILLDEPTYGLDEHRRASLLERVSQLDAAKQMLLITHHDVGGAAGHHIRIEKRGKRSTQEGAPDDAAAKKQAKKKKPKAKAADADAGGDAGGDAGVGADADATGSTP